MKTINFYFCSALIAVAALSMTACSDDDNVGNTDGTLIETPMGHMFSISANIGSTDTRVSLEGDEDGAKAKWEMGDKIYMKYTINGTVKYFLFSTTAMSEDATEATFTCVDFTYPEDATDISFVYVGNKKVSSIEDLAIELSTQTQTSNNGWANLGNFIYMNAAVSGVSNEETLKAATLNFAHQNSITTFVIEEPYNWGDKLKTMKAKLVSSTMTLEGTTDNTVTLNLNDVEWADNQIVAHIAIMMDGTLGEGDHWELQLDSEKGFTATGATQKAVLQGIGKVYTTNIKMPEYFPMEDFNAKIRDLSGNATWDAATGTYTPGEQYAVGGWQFASDLNLSYYTQLVIELSSDTDASGVKVRIYDEDNVWGEGNACEIYFDEETKKVVVDLTNMVSRDNAERKVDPSKIRIIGISSNDVKPITIKRISLVQNPDNMDPENPVFPDGGDETGFSATIPNFTAGEIFE